MVSFWEMVDCVSDGEVAECVPVHVFELTASPDSESDICSVSVSVSSPISHLNGDVSF